MNFLLFASRNNEHLSSIRLTIFRLSPDRTNEIQFNPPLNTINLKLILREIQLTLFDWKWIWVGGVWSQRIKTVHGDAIKCVVYRTMPWLPVVLDSLICVGAGTCTNRFQHSWGNCWLESVPFRRTSDDHQHHGLATVYNIVRVFSHLWCIVCYKSTCIWFYCIWFDRNWTHLLAHVSYRLNVLAPRSLHKQHIKGKGDCLR